MCLYMTGFKNYFATCFRIVGLLCNLSFCSYGFKISVLRSVDVIRIPSHNRVKNLLQGKSQWETRQTLRQLW